MRRIVVPSSLLTGIEPPVELPLSGPSAHYAVHVLRLAAGDHVKLIDGAGLAASATITSVSGRSLTARIDAVDRTDAGESPLDLGLMVGLPKGDRWDWVIQKCTELGVHRLWPVYTDRGDVYIPPDRLDRRLERWRRISAEATRQCRRSWAPEILFPRQVGAVLEALGDPLESELRLVASVGVSGGRADNSLRDYVQSTTAHRITLLIGPEGGLTGKEIALAVDAGFHPIGLGPRVLRTETAAVALCALVQGYRGDLDG